MKIQYVNETTVPRAQVTLIRHGTNGPGILGAFLHPADPSKWNSIIPPSSAQQHTRRTAHSSDGATSNHKRTNQSVASNTRVSFQEVITRRCPNTATNVAKRVHCVQEQRRGRRNSYVVCRCGGGPCSVGNVDIGAAACELINPSPNSPQ